MSDPKRHEDNRRTASQPPQAWLDLVREQVGSLRFGTVLITVHDGRVVQVEKNEKVRLDSPGS